MPGLPSPRVAELIGLIAGRLLNDSEAMMRDVDSAVFAVSPILSSDVTLAAETRASNRANVLRWLSAMQCHPAEPMSTEVAPEALDLARSLVRRGTELDVLLHAYRRGQNVAWRRWMERAADIVGNGPELVEVLDLSSSLMFSYVDGVVGVVLGQMQREREELLGGALARRTETVRLILDGAPIDVGRATRRLGYELGNHHTAAVVWAESPTPAQGSLERAANVLAHVAGARRPLTLPVGTTTLWAWLPSYGDPDPAALRAAMNHTAPEIRVVLGPTREGITGFRRSHVAALAAQRLLAGNRDGERLTTYHEVEVVALAAQDEERMSEFVASTLGPLAGGDPATLALRETVRVYLDEGGNAPRAAERLHTHRNTVLHRVSRAEELLGYSLRDRRLAVSLALELVHRLGARALTPR